MMLSIQTSKKQYQPHLMIVSGLVKNIRLSVERMEKLIFQLTQIRNLHPSPAIRNAADGFLSQQSKVKEVAEDLVGNVKEFGYLLSKSNDLPEADEIITQYQLECELMDDLDFTVRKRLLGFVQQNFEARVISFATVAA